MPLRSALNHPRSDIRPPWTVEVQVLQEQKPATAITFMEEENTGNAGAIVSAWPWSLLRMTARDGENADNAWNNCQCPALATYDRHGRWKCRFCRSKKPAKAIIFMEEENTGNAGAIVSAWL